MKFFIMIILLLFSISSFSKQLIHCENGSLSYSFDERNLKNFKDSWVSDDYIDLEGKFTEINYLTEENSVNMKKTR